VALKYRIQYLASVVATDIPRLSKPAQSRIRRAIETKLTSHPIEFGKPLRYSLKGARSLRVGEYRVIFTIETDGVALIVKIGHRADVYKP
jgi:mRNA interferase RelE/StbE